MVSFSSTTEAYQFFHLLRFGSIERLPYTVHCQVVEHLYTGTRCLLAASSRNCLFVGGGLTELHRAHRDYCSIVRIEYDIARARFEAAQPDEEPIFFHDPMCSCPFCDD